MPWIIIQSISVVSHGSPPAASRPAVDGGSHVLGRGNQPGGVGQALVQQPFGGLVGPAGIMRIR